MSCKTLYVVRDLLRVWVGFRAVNVTGRVGSVRAVSNDFGFGPGSGFSLKPVQTSTEEVSGEDTAGIEEPESSQETSEVYVDVGMEALPAMTIQELRAGQKEDRVIGPILYFKSRNRKPRHSERMTVGATGGLLLKEGRRLLVKKGILYRSIRDRHKVVLEQLILPEKLRETIKMALHNDSGHLGFERTLQMIRERFYWPRMFQEIKAWCEQCERCCLRKTPTANVRAPLVSILDAGKVQGWYGECAHCHGPLFSLCAGLPHQGPKGSNSSQGLVEEFLLPVWVPCKVAR